MAVCTTINRNLSDLHALLVTLPYTQHVGYSCLITLPCRFSKFFSTSVVTWLRMIYVWLGKWICNNCGNMQYLPHKFKPSTREVYTFYALWCFFRNHEIVMWLRPIGTFALNAAARTLCGSGVRNETLWWKPIRQSINPSSTISPREKLISCSDEEIWWA